MSLHVDVAVGVELTAQHDTRALLAIVIRTQAHSTRLHPSGCLRALPLSARRHKRMPRTHDSLHERGELVLTPLLHDIVEAQCGTVDTL